MSADPVSLWLGGAVLTCGCLALTPVVPAVAIALAVAALVLYGLAAWAA